MKITNIIEETKSISSNIKNAYIDFSKMTISLVAVCSDVIKNGKPVIGYGFNSNGRYGQGHLIRERFRPRLLEALPKDIINEDGTNFDPHKMWNIMMKNEKPGGHGERSVAVGTIDMAIWDLISKIEEKPLYQVLAERYGNSIPNRNVFVYAAGGYYWPDQGLQGLTDEIKKYLDLGYSVVKKKIGGASLSEDSKELRQY
jgi:L-alanine-DL-glutamate epimerase-like enolase superfamily enzyme